MSTEILTKVRNYQGQNSFVNKMKESLQKWGNLTPKQLMATQKCLSGETTTNKTVELPEEMKIIVSYEGENTFVNDIKSKFLKYGTLTDKQKQAALNTIQKEKDRKDTVMVKVPTPGESILVGRKIGQQLKEKYNLEFNPTIIDITKIVSVSPRAVQFTGKMTIKRGKVCMCCNKTLTDEFSMLTNMGKTCAGHMKVEYITDASQAEAFRERYLKRVEEIGEMTFWVPKKQIKKWEGFSQIVMEMV